MGISCFGCLKIETEGSGHKVQGPSQFIKAFYTGLGQKMAASALETNGHEVSIRSMPQTAFGLGEIDTELFEFSVKMGAL